jgi:hypothetical protein
MVCVFSGLANKTRQYVWLKAKNEHGASGFSPYGYGTPWPSGEAPQTPSKPAVIPGADRLTLSWEAAGGAESYEVYISTTTTRPGSPLMTVDGTTAIINSLDNGVIYYLWLRAKNGNGSSAGYSDIQAGTPDVPAAVPAAPANPVLIAGNRKLTVTWQAVEMAAAYEVWRGSSDNPAAAVLCGTISDGATGTVLENLTNGTSYYVWLKAKNSIGSSGFSPYASAVPSASAEAPAAPGAAPVVTPGSGQLVVSWQAVEGATGYEVWKGESNNISSAAKYGGDIGTTSVIVTGLANGTTCYFWIKAKNSAGTSGASPAASGTPSISDAPPAAPTAPTVTAASGQLTVSWSPVPGAAAYEVWTASSNNTAAAVKLGPDITGLSTVISGLTNGVPCYVWLKAKNNKGSSGFSPAASGIPSASSVTGLTPATPGVSLGDGQLAVTWTALEGASWYQIWLSAIDNFAGALQYGGNITGSLSTTITGLTNGLTYYIWIRAGNGTDTSNFSGKASGIPIADAAAPSVNAGNGQLVLNWAAITGAAEYDVFYSTGTTPPPSPAQTVSAPSAAITGLTNGTTYHVWVRCKNPTGTGATSPAASGKPIGDMGTVTLASGNGQLSANWAAVPGADQYEVYYSTGETMPGSPALTVFTLSATISGLTNGTTYYLWVKPINPKGTGTASTAVSGKPLARPEAPTLTVGNGQLTVTWTAVPGADGYEVYCDASPFPTTFKTTASGVSATITGLTNETLYYVRLKAKGGSAITEYGPAANEKPTASALYKGAVFGTAVKIGHQNLAASLTYISANAVTGDNYYIVLETDEPASPKDLAYSGKTIGITLMGTGEERRISLDSAGSLFTVNTGVTLTLDDKITLNGRVDNSAPLLRINNGGFLIMNMGSKISNNTSSSYSAGGGGVYVDGYGTFTMKGGEIGNTASTYYGGGGVYVAINGAFIMENGEISGNTAGVFVGGTFTMEGGEISGNTTSTYGGGVSVGGYGTFTMKGGEISGNTASTYYGGGVYVAIYGTFTMEGGEISGNTASSSGGGV